MIKRHVAKGLLNLISVIRELSNSLIETELRKRGISDIVPAHGAVLSYLFQQNKPIPIYEIVNNSNRVKSTITSMLNTLESYGYIRRLPSEKDNRSLCVELTEKGWSLKGHFFEISELIMQKVYGNMTETDKAKLVELLSLIENNLS